MEKSLFGKRSIWRICLNCKDFFALFPNRSLLLRVLVWDQKRGYTETHTKRAAVSTVARPGAARAVLKFIEKNQ